ncbi:acyltransferase family protein [Clostridium neonatale]|uniref:acyltransferase family protein n=1 Tax=Clostridium neonatale TaxID=137838 RepID=UPI00291B63BC|nr:membrane hypothetical protein [Clostridium neonatale]
MSKEKIKSFDLIRCVCMLGIVQDHFISLCREYKINFKLLEFLGGNYGNLGWGSVGTAIFFMISGSVLIYNYEDKNFDTKQFYFNRFIKMCPILYFTHIICYIIISIINNQLVYPITIKNILNMFIGKTLVGEWFTTVIFVCYILFPLFKNLYNRYKVQTTIIFTIIFIINQKLLLLTAGGKWASYTNGIFEFWLGMILINYINRLNRKHLLTLSICFICMPFVSKAFDLNGTWFYIPTIISSIILFLLMLHINISNSFIDKISEYSYGIYLVHHQIMYLTFPIFAISITNQIQCLLSFIILMVLIYITAEKVSNINTKFIQRIKNI